MCVCYTYTDPAPTASESVPKYSDSSHSMECPQNLQNRSGHPTRCIPAREPQQPTSIAIRLQQLSKYIE